MGKKDHKKEGKQDSHKKDKKKRKAEKREEEEAKRKRLKQEKEIEKARSKANETPEERNTRRLAKKQAKEALKKEEKSLFGYTNENNPFGDASLTKAFVWKKKYERQVKEGNKVASLTKQQLREKQIHLRSEIEKVKSRRAEREIEVQQMEEMREQIERDAMREQEEGWAEKEEEFFRDQAKKRSEIRIKEGREKAVDILAKNLYIYTNDESLDAEISIDLDVELVEPYHIFDGLGLCDLEELHKDIKVYVELKSNEEYWNALSTMAEDKILKIKIRRKGAEVEGLNATVMESIHKMLDNKNSKKLIKLEKDINWKLESGGKHGEKIDVGYWETVLKELTVFKAKSYLSEFHEKLLEKRLKQLKKQHKQKRRERDDHSDSGADSDRDRGGDKEDWEPNLLSHGDMKDELIKEKAKRKKDKTHEYENLGDLEPALLVDTDDEDAVTPEEDEKSRAAHRNIILEQRRAERESDRTRLKEEAKESREKEEALEAGGHSRFMLSSEEMFNREASKEAEEGDEVFSNNQEIAEPSKEYWWHDKYRPRKPRYFNRVRTGFDWNKYNQTHYDKENPPPKIVQGYKFNVFYPDLIDPSKPPQYRIEDVEDSMDVQIIRFMAGAPYEDVAFKIVKKKWEFSHKRGYKFVFDKGVLQLYVNFMRFRYRR